MVSYHTEVANARNIGYDGRRKGAEPLYWVYVLVCRDGSLYTGMTNDLRRRMVLHMTAAARLEYAVKTLPRARKLALLAAPEQVGEVFPALAGYDCAPVRDAALEQLLEGKYDG